MAYQALYRTYRPSNFDEVVGQKHVVKTLKNALIENKISHAYLFSGPRGIGKTTIARIFAKAINCKNLVDGKPCEQCDACKAINNNETTDIIELDAASNNGVDEMRDLLERVNYLPSMLSKKVYIIDEVHMLSGSAFNALLKTLEEPPAYVVFIFATTEVHKIPLTILSRCQRFDFKPIGLEDIIEELGLIAEREGLDLNEDAKIRIAEASEGGMRDALSILDQASVYADGAITSEDVNAITGNIDDVKIIELIKAFNNLDATLAIKLINDLLDSGKEVSRLITCIVQFCRDLLLFKNINEIPLKYVNKQDDFADLAIATDNLKLFYYIDTLIDVQNKIRFTNSKKVYLEVAVVKIVNSANDDINLAKRIEALEEQVNSGSISGGDPGYSSPQMQLLEAKVNKLMNSANQNASNGFEEKINAKINMLEDVVSKTSVLPTSLEERIHVLEGRLNEIELSGKEGLNDNQTTTSLEAINHLEEVIKETVEYEVKNYINNEPAKANNIEASTYDDSHLLNEISSLKEHIARLELSLEEKSSLSLYNNEKQERNTESISEAALSNIEARLNRLEQRPVSVPSNNYSNNNSEIEAKINELKTNYFILAKMVEANYGVKPQESTTTFASYDDTNLREEISILKSKVINLEKEIENLKKAPSVSVSPVVEEPIKEEAKEEIAEEIKEEAGFEEESEQEVAQEEAEEVESQEEDVEEPKEVEEIKEEVQEVVLEEKKEEPIKEVSDWNPYDIHILEAILNESLSMENRQAKEKMKVEWNKIGDKVGGILAGTASLLLQGSLTAVGNDYVLIVYPDIANCNFLMQKKYYEEVCQILDVTFAKPYKFLALPANVWAEKRQEFYDLYRVYGKSNSNIKLSPFKNPELKVVNDDSREKTKKQKTLELASSFFGDDE